MTKNTLLNIGLDLCPALPIADNPIQDALFQRIWHKSGVWLSNRLEKGTFYFCGAEKVECPLFQPVVEIVNSEGNARSPN